jgi:hypothetical protein
MKFWERVILWWYLSLAETLPVGRDALGRLLALASQRGRLFPAAVNECALRRTNGGGDA